MKITKLETSIPVEVMPEVLALRIHTDAGYIGCGETYYAPHAVEAMIHDWMGRRLLGCDPLAIESHWRFLYERTSNFGSRGCELRAISAIDLALWDIFGQLCGQPVWQLLGGRAQTSIPLYNSSGGPAYGGRNLSNPDSRGWPGYGEVGCEGPLNDYWSVLNKPVDYAKELIGEGYAGVKMWTLDSAAHKPGGPLHISHRDLDEALQPLRDIRAALGKEIEIMLDGHGFFQLPAALRIARAVRDIDPLWLEDVMRVDCIDTLVDFRNKAAIPLAVSEMMIGSEDYRMVLEKRGADYIMIDPTWVGGISQSRRIAQLAQIYNIPVVMHDCTGPLTFLSGLHIATASTNVAWQESVRAHIRLLYPRLIDEKVIIRDGRAMPPERPGLGAAWLPSLFESTRNHLRMSQL